VGATHLVQRGVLRLLSGELQELDPHRQRFGSSSELKPELPKRDCGSTGVT